MGLKKKKDEEKKTVKVREKRQPSFVEAISTIVIMLALFGLGAIYDLQSAPLMVMAAAYAGLIAFRCGMTWKEMEEIIADKIKQTVPAMSILLAVGFLMGAWMFSGTIPMCIYFGVQMISQRWILLSSFILCAIFSLVTGTSMGSAGTAGLAMIGIAMGMPDVNLAAVAGACYAGSVFGDKLSPLSDTTVLASLVTRNDIFDHIKHMMKTVLPAALLGAACYIVMGMGYTGSEAGLPENTVAMLGTLDQMFKWNIILLLPMVMILWGALTRKPSTLVMLASAALAIVLGVFYQGFRLSDGVNVLYSGFYSGLVESVRPGFTVDTMSSDALLLLERGGLTSMLKPFILCYLCFYFAAIVDKSGCLNTVLGKLLASVKSTFGLVFFTAVTVVLLTMIGGSSTIALLMGGELFLSKFEEQGLSTLNLSRTLEDFGTGSSAFFPWTSSGAYYPVVFGVGNFAFFKYSFMSYFIWILALVYAFTGKCIKPLEEERRAELEQERMKA